MKTILFVTHYADLYGANKSLLNTIDGLSKSYNFIVIINGRGTLINELTIRNIKWHSINYTIFQKHPQHTSFKYWSWYFRKRLSNLLYLIIYSLFTRLSNVDLIHSNSSVIDFGFWLSKLSKKPHIWHLREFQTIDYNIHLDKSIAEQSCLISKSDVVIAISKSIALHFNLTEKASIVYNGVVSKEKTHKPVTKNTYFLFVGLIQIEKGLIPLLFAIHCAKSQCQDIKLLIIGDGTDHIKRYIIELCEYLDISRNVEMVGYSNDVLTYMQNARALIMPSFHEGLGRVTLEAMSQGCTVIGYASAGTAELISKDFAFPYNTNEELVNSLISLHTNLDLSMEMGERARCHFIDKYTLETYCESINRIYRNLLVKA